MPRGVSGDKAKDTFVDKMFVEDTLLTVSYVSTSCRIP